MKIFAAAFAVAFLTQAIAIRSSEGNSENPIDKVVEFLRKLLSKSRDEGETEAKMYSEFRCYCEENDKSASANLVHVTEAISKLESEVESLQAENGEMSTQCAKLTEDIADNVASQRQATEIRSKAFKEFKAEAVDLRNAIGQLSQAISILADVGADQTQSSGSDHARFMSGSRKKKSGAFLSLDSDIKHALHAAFALVPAERRHVVDAFLQAPFTGRYSSQSAGVVGILKSMLSTFFSNLESATDSDRKDDEATTALLQTLGRLEHELSNEYEEKQEQLGENDSELAAKKSQLNAATEQKDSEEDFLRELRPNCEKKAKEFGARKLLRASEETAIAEAVSILSAEGAFDVLARPEKSVNAASFIQQSANQMPAGDEVWKQAQEIIAKAAANGSRLSQMSSLLQARNPFTVVLKEIRQMMELIKAEQGSDEEKHALCKQQTGSGQRKLNATYGEIDKIDDALEKLQELLEMPETGLKAQEESLEQAMVDNVENQKRETSLRQQENGQYQKNVGELTKAEALLEKAIKVLTTFYSSLDERSGVAMAAFAQRSAKTRKSLQIWDGAYDGQSRSVDGEDGAVGLLRYILKETTAQHTHAHMDEAEAQEDFEDNMAHMINEQKRLEKQTIKLKNAVANTEQGLVEQTQDLKQAEKDAKATEALLADIKPGCDFILDNFESRTASRNLEAKALARAVNLLRTSPAYQAASAEVEAQALGPHKVK